MVKHQNPEKFNAFVAARLTKALFAVFLIELGIAAAQTPTDQALQIELQKEKERERLARAQRDQRQPLLGSRRSVRSGRSESSGCR